MKLELFAAAAAIILGFMVLLTAFLAWGSVKSKNHCVTFTVSFFLETQSFQFSILVMFVMLIYIGMGTGLLLAYRKQSITNF